MFRILSAYGVQISGAHLLPSFHLWLSNLSATNLFSHILLVSRHLTTVGCANSSLNSFSDFFTIARLSNALLGSVIVSCVGLGAAIFAFFLIELKTVGRWHLVFWGVIGITLSMRKFRP